jgi:hypothetical protein
LGRFGGEIKQNRLLSQRKNAITAAQPALDALKENAMNGAKHFIAIQNKKILEN